VADDILWEYQRGQGWDLQQLRVEHSDEDGRLAISVYADDEAAWVGVDLLPEAVVSLVGALRVWLEEHPPSVAGAEDAGHGDGDGRGEGQPVDPADH
jgi:hypothetical protein